MLRPLKSIFKLMGQGLAHQYHDEMSSTTAKIDEIVKRCHNYNTSAERSRVILIAGADLMNSALDFVIELANNTNSLIEILYYKQKEKNELPLTLLLNRLSDQAHDFQVTFITGDLDKKVTSYHKQRQDIMAVVSSASETFLGELGVSSPKPRPAKYNGFPDITIIGDSFLA